MDYFDVNKKNQIHLAAYEDFKPQELKHDMLKDGPVL